MQYQEAILYLVTMVVTWILGKLSKKFDFVNSNLIPLQNLLIGFIMCLIYWGITKEFNPMYIIAGLTAGGAYDIPNNLNKIKQGNKEWEENCEEKIGE